MRMCVLTWFVLGCVLHAVAQYNLVPNHSFEENQGCPTAGAQIGLVDHWVNVVPSVDYYHECGAGGYGVPANIFGGGYALSGQAYIGLHACASPFSVLYPNFINAREFVGASLYSPLISGVEYYVEFNVRRSAAFCYATKNIGAFLSTAQPSGTTEHLLSLLPQVRYQGRDFIVDSDDWTKISGTFVAQGGENFITIGNFDDDENTDTLFVSCINNSTNYLFSAYFIDDVSVIPVDSLVGMEERVTASIRIYPNPASSMLTVEGIVPEGETATFELQTITGSMLMIERLTDRKTTMDVSDLPSGLYIYRVSINQHPVHTGKQVILR